MLGGVSLARNRDAWNRGGSDDGVSVVVSAVLVFGLIIMVLATYTATIVPDQIRDAEAAHMRRVNGDLGDLATRLGQASSLTGGGQFAQQMDLGTTSVPFFAAVESTGQLGVADEAFFSSLSCDTTNLVARDGAAAPGATFATASGSMVVEDVLVLEFLVTSYVYDSMVGAVTTSVTAAGPDGTTLGTFQLVLDNSAATVRTLDGDGALVVEQVVQQTSGQIDSLRVDVMNRIYGFASLLEDAQGERTLTFSSGTGAVTVYSVGRADDGTLVTKGTGRALPPGFARSVNSASLVYTSHNHRFMDQTYALEGGAIVLSQDAGDFLTVVPFRLVNPAAGTPYLSLDLISITGTGDTSGTHRATVSVVVRAPVHSLVECVEPRVLVTSEYQGGWATAWQHELTRAGLGTAPLNPTAEFLAVSLPGTWFVELTEVRAELRVS